MTKPHAGHATLGTGPSQDGPVTRNDNAGVDPAHAGVVRSGRDQNLTLTPSCTCRSTVPQSEHEGFDSIVEIVP